jgi:hypothetical protein
MGRHLTIYTPRTGSTVVYNSISQTLCDPPFNFNLEDFYSSEIHPCEYKLFYDKLKKLSNSNIDWSMKYLVSTGVTHPENDDNFNLFDTDKFFKDLGVTDLHFCFRVDMIDTICSNIIAEMDDSYVVTNGEIRKHEKRHVPKSLIDITCFKYNYDKILYNSYVSRYSNNFNSKFYHYENLHKFVDTDNDIHKLKKQLTKEQKQELIINYDEVIEIAKTYDFYYGKINPMNGVLEYDK